MVAHPMNRRSVLQTLLAIFGFGAANAVAKTVDPASPFKGPFDLGELIQPQFDSAIGVVSDGRKLHVAIISLSAHGTRSSWSMAILNRAVWQLAIDAKFTKGMIFAESNGPAGAQLVAELMKRCPECVWRDKRQNSLSGVIIGGETKPGYDTSLLKPEWLDWLPKKHNWTTDNKYQAMARCLALLGKNIVSNQSKANNMLRFFDGDSREFATIQ
jgi:hypothetical protein